MSNRENVLLTGGTGYIGSHTACELLMRGYDVVILDNLTNSTVGVVNRIEKISRKKCSFVQGDIRDRRLVVDTLREFQISAVIHFAGLKSVSDSFDDPVSYYSTNVAGTVVLIDAMQEVGVTSLVFSSSATVYGVPQALPVDELHPTSPVNPYGRSKLQVEHILKDLSESSPSWSIACLRYFNPAGAHDSGLIGEQPSTRPNNLLPVVAEVATGQRSKLLVFGSDYPTPDGTGIRDFIHVMDLAEGHEAALRYIADRTGLETFNLGTGTGYSVLEMAAAYHRASGRDIPIEFAPRRPGDVASCYADTDKARSMLDWHARRNLDDMCSSSWNFVSRAADI